ncbi:protein Dok-7-like isoform X2 [Corythoichthys intestinalis]|uniref:protein Dok-7-like isoform X2 n=1 Tax=Corythoichthys intestinalis TaxID=161448 RepID=UPI0025A5E97E|nr:protein Dok-7-like isoform X2 [Corythoichthys intestinalis]
MTDSVVVEGYARLKDGKKWKTRWVVFRKPSPVADCLVLLVFKDESDKADGNKEGPDVTLEEICGLESGRRCEGAFFTLAILCLSRAAVLAFDSEETLRAWEVRLRYSLGEVHRFDVGVLAGTKLESGPATLHLCNNLLALARDAPPVVVGHWNLPDLRRYGPVPNGFVFEGGTRCGYWAGVFLLSSRESEQISFLFDRIVRGVSPTRGPRPLLPDPSSSRTDVEERLNHETRELEKRLSVLSNRHGGTASPVCRANPGDDGRNVSGSSESSDSLRSDGDLADGDLADGDLAGAQAASPEKRPANRSGGNAPEVGDPSGRLLEMARRSSLDSGIATGSHSSYSGSFSSCTESLDISGGEDFGSVFSLPPRSAQDLSPCSCPNLSGREYKVPTSLRYLYHTPRSLARDRPTLAHHPVTESLEGTSDAHPRSTKTRGRPPSDDPESGATKTILTICSECGGFQGMPFNPASAVAIPALPAKMPDGGEERRRADPSYETAESRAPGPKSEADEKSKYESVLGHGAQKTEGGATAYHRERSAVTYVNIPVSPTSKKQLDYMELDLQEPGARGAPVPGSAHNEGKGSAKYAQIDIAATETAREVGTRHALGRQEGLRTLERRKKATPH